MQAHYCARAVFDPPGIDPVPLRSGFWWRWNAAVPVPELPEPPPRSAPPPTTHRIIARDDDDTRRKRAAAYAQACIKTIETAPDGQRHPVLINTAITVFGLVEHGLLDEADALADLQAAADHQGWSTTRRDELLAWARAVAEADKPLPDGF